MDVFQTLLRNMRMSGSQPTSPPSTEGSIWHLLQFLGAQKSPQEQEYEAFQRRLDAIEHHLSQPVNMRLERGDDGLVTGAVASYPTPADAYEFNAPVVKQSVADAIATAQKPEFWKDAANQYANALVAGTSTPGFRAFHGSPYDFDKFDMGKIGTGEGAQAYGHGLYFAGNEGVARSYRDRLSVEQSGEDQFIDTPDGRVRRSSELQDLTPHQRALLISANNKGDVGKALAQAKEFSKDYYAGRLWPDVISHLENSPDKYSGAQWQMPGHMYEVNIAADPEHFLDWDKPLSEQNEHVKNALSKIMPPEYTKSSLPGGQVAPSTDEGIKRLSDVGIPGIRYLDAQSRNAGGWHITPPNETVSGKWMVKSSDYNSKGEHYDTEAEARAALEKKIAGQTSNYVVFKPEIIEILRKYGLLGMLGGGAAGAAYQSKED